MSVTVAAGGNAAMVFVLAGALDADPVATLTIVNNQTSATVLTATITELGFDGATDYSYVWQTSTSQTVGSYTATLAGEISNVAVTSAQTVYVTAIETYISLGDFKAMALPSETSTARDTALARILAASTRAVNDHCGRVFTRSASLARIFSVQRHSGRVVDFPEGPVLLTDDIAAAATATVAVGSPATSWTTLSSATIVPYPLNSVDIGVASEGLMILGASLGSAFVRVTAEWGWPAVPASVEEATVLTARRLLSRDGSPDGIRGNAEWGLIRVPRLDPDVVALLESVTKAAF